MSSKQNSTYIPTVLHNLSTKKPKATENFLAALKLLLRYNNIKSKANPKQSQIGTNVSKRMRLPEISDSRHINVIRLSALSSGRLYPPQKIPGNHICHWVSRTQGHIAAGRIKSVKNLKDPII